MARPSTVSNGHTEASGRGGVPSRSIRLPGDDEETWRRFCALAALEGLKPAALVWRLVCTTVEREWTERGPGNRAA